METKPSDKKSLRWQPTVAGLILATLLVAPIIVVATRANPPPTDRGSGPVGSQVGPSSSVWREIGSFTHGYIEFDVDPTQQGGVPGFDSWPPGRPR